MNIKKPRPETTDRGFPVIIRMLLLIVVMAALLSPSEAPSHYLGLSVVGGEFFVLAAMAMRGRYS